MTTFEHEGAVYTCRALTEGEAQDAADLAIDLLNTVCTSKGLPFDEERKSYISAYPYSLQAPAYNFARWHKATVIDGSPSHTQPETFFDYLNPEFFGRWVLEVQRSGDLWSKWDEAFNSAQKASDTPLAEAAESEAAPA